MNKKILFLVLLLIILVLPFRISAQLVQVPQIVINIQTASLLIGASIVIIGWVIAGILWLISAGNPEKTGLAKKATGAAIIGTVLIILSKVAYMTICQLLYSGQCT